MSHPTPALALGSLQALQADRLHVFVAGPGVGEAIAIALPQRGWVLIDGCSTSGSYPTLELFKRFRRGPDDGIDCFVWTHPHLDHSAGVARLISEETPRTVALTGVTTMTTWLHRLAEFEKQTTNVTSQHQETLRVRQAIAAVQRFAEDHPGALLPLHAGATIPTTDASVTITAVSPDPAKLSAWLAKHQTASSFFRTSNELSLALRLEYGSTQVVLGGDLPRLKSKRGHAVATGWNTVLTAYPDLGTHAAMKLPHHGSPEAFHPDLHTKGRGRTWWLTPFNSSGLPSVFSLDGLPRLLDREPSVALTALPASKKLQAPLTAAGGQIKLALLAPRTPGRRTGGVKLQDDALYVKPEREPLPLEPIWCTVFDDRGQATARYRGSVALEVLA